MVVAFALSALLSACAVSSAGRGPRLATGHIVFRSGNEVGTDLGARNEIRAGNRMLVFDVTSEERHPVSGELMRVQLKSAGVIRVRDVGERSSSAVIQSGDVSPGQYVRPLPGGKPQRELWWEDAPAWWRSLVLRDRGAPDPREVQAVPYPRHLR